MPLPLDGRPKPQQLPRHLLPGRLEHIDQRPGQRLVVLREQRDGQPLGARASRAADAVDVVLDRQGERDVDDGSDGGDVEAAGGDVGGDEERGGAGFEGGEGGGAFLLRHVAVDGGDFGPLVAAAAEAGAEEGFDAGGFLFVEAEDEDAGGVSVGAAGAGLVLFDELEEAGFFLAGVDDFDELGYFCVGAELVGGVVGADGDVDGVMHEG